LGARFSEPSRPALWPTQPHQPQATTYFPEGKAAGVWCWQVTPI